MSTLATTAGSVTTEATVTLAAIHSKSVAPHSAHASVAQRLDTLAYIEGYLSDRDAAWEEGDDSHAVEWVVQEPVRLPRLSTYYGVPAAILRDTTGAAAVVAGLRIVPRSTIEQGSHLPWPVEVADFSDAWRAVAVAEVECRCCCPGAAHLLLTDAAVTLLGADPTDFPVFWPEFHNVGCTGGYALDPSDL